MISVERQMSGADEADADIRLIRAGAVIMVFICHLFEIYGSAAAWWLNAGVQVFLCISGYVFGGRMIRNWRAWYGRRLTRILLPYYLLILAVVLGNVFFVRGNDLVAPLLASLLGVQDFFKICLPGCDHLWFITLILVCYLFVPALQALRERTRGRAGAAALCFVALPVAFYGVYKIFNFMTYAYVANLSAFAFGYYLGGMRGRAVAPGRLQAAAVPCVLSAVILSLAGRGVIEYFTLTESAPWSGLYSKLLLPWSKVGFGVALLVLIAGRGGRAGSGRVVGFIDRYSYEIYLTHHLFIFGPFSLIPLFSSRIAGILVISLLTLAASVVLKRLASTLSLRREPEASVATPAAEKAISA